MSAAFFTHKMKCFDDLYFFKTSQAKRQQNRCIIQSFQASNTISPLEKIHTRRYKDMSAKVVVVAIVVVAVVIVAALMLKKK